MKLSADTSADVRAWAVRGLAIPAPTAASRAGGAPPPPAFDWSAIDRAPLAAKLRAALDDADRRVRTEALRALTSHDDDASVAAILTAIDSTDTWISVSAVEGLARFPSRATAIVPRLLTAITPDRPDALRQATFAPLAALAPDKAVDLAAALTKSTERRDSRFRRPDARPSGRAGPREARGGVRRGSRLEGLRSAVTGHAARTTSAAIRSRRV